MNDVVTLWQEMLGETRQEDGWRAGLGSGIKALIVNLRTQFLFSILTPGRELHANKFLSEIVEVLTVSHSGEMERNINPLCDKSSSQYWRNKSWL